MSATYSEAAFSAGSIPAKGNPRFQAGAPMGTAFPAAGDFLVGEVLGSDGRLLGIQ